MPNPMTQRYLESRILPLENSTINPRNSLTVVERLNLLNTRFSDLLTKVGTDEAKSGVFNLLQECINLMSQCENAYKIVEQKAAAAQAEIDKYDKLLFQSVDEIPTTGGRLSIAVLHWQLVQYIEYEMGGPLE